MSKTMLISLRNVRFHIFSPKPPTHLQNKDKLIDRKIHNNNKSIQKNNKTLLNLKKIQDHFKNCSCLMICFTPKI